MPLDSKRKKIIKKVGVVAGVCLAALVTYETFYWATHVYEYDARIEAKLTTLSSRVDGEIEKVYVTEGDLVKEGDLLVALKANVQKLNIKALEADLTREEAQRTKLEVEILAFENDLTSRLENIKGLDSKEFDLLIGGAKEFGKEVDNLIESAGGGEDFARKMEMSKESLNAIDGFEDKIFKVKSFVTDPQFRSTLMKGFFIGLAVTAATKLGEAIKDTFPELSTANKLASSPESE